MLHHPLKPWCFEGTTLTLSTTTRRLPNQREHFTHTSNMAEKETDSCCTVYRTRAAGAFDRPLVYPICERRGQFPSFCYAKIPTEGTLRATPPLLVIFLPLIAGDETPHPCQFSEEEKTSPPPPSPSPPSLPPMADVM